MTGIPDASEGDFLTVLSSELIAEVMQEYFNKKMYRQKVKVVDLQPQGSGYAFSLAFVKDAPIEPIDVADTIDVMSPENMSFLRNGLTQAMRDETDAIMDSALQRRRDSKGKFTKRVDANA